MSKATNPADRLTLYDKVRGYFDPTEGLVRMRAREIQANIKEFSYGYNDDPIARSSSGGMFAHAQSENWKSNRDRIKAMWDARDLARFEFIGGMVARIILYTCGKLHSKSLTGDENIDQVYDDYFHGWCGDEPGEDGLVRCDLSGRHRLIKKCQQALWGFIVDGDHGLLEVDPQFSPTGEYCLQSIEADRIGSPLEVQVTENYIGGVTIDPQDGRIQSYRVFRRTRTTQYVEPQEISPSGFIHLFDSDLSDEYRGRTKLLRILNDARDIREWVEAEKRTGKVQSQWAALVGLKDPFKARGPEGWSKKTPDGTPTQPAEWGQILKMAESEVFSMLAPPSRPSGAFMEFIDFIIRKMAVSMDLPYGFLWNLATLGGVTARIEVQQALRRIEYWQQLLTDKILNRVRQKVIAQGILKNLLPPHPMWRKCEWHFGLSIQTDVGYEMDADIAAVSAGLLPITDVSGKYGYSPHEVFISNARTANEAIQVGTESDLPVEVFARGLFPDITLQKANMVTGPVPPPEPGTFEAVGDKGIKQIVDLIKSVGEGKVDKDAAVQTLIHSYGIPDDIAKKMIPDEPSPAKLKALNPPAAGAGGRGQVSKSNKKPSSSSKKKK